MLELPNYRYQEVKPIGTIAYTKHPPGITNEIKIEPTRSPATPRNIPPDFAGTMI